MRTLLKPEFAPTTRIDPTCSCAFKDWSYAQRELALARLNGQDPGLDALRDEDLDKLFDNVSISASVPRSSTTDNLMVALLTSSFRKFEPFAKVHVRNRNSGAEV